MWNENPFTMFSGKNYHFLWLFGSSDIHYVGHSYQKKTRESHQKPGDVLMFFSRAEKVRVPWNSTKEANVLRFFSKNVRVLWCMRSFMDHPPPLKMYEKGGGTREFFIHFQGPPTLKRAFLYEFFFVKLRDYLERWGVVLIHFQYLASKACLEKGGEAVSYIDFARPWMFDAHGVFLGNLTK